MHNRVGTTNNHLPDTLLFRSINMSALSLPKEVRVVLEKHYSNVKKKLDFIGPIWGRYGKWYFKIKEVKPGGLPIPFDMVKQEIIDTLVKPYLNTSDEFTNEEINITRLEERLTKAYITNTLDEIEKISKEDIQLLIENGEIDTSTFVPELKDNDKLEQAREILNMQKHKNLEKMTREWIASLKIDEDILFR